jgi:anti-anti-sigma regulatory factor
VKLKLTHEKGVEVLSASGPIVDHESKVLRAGISKILKTGKNKIVLELPESPDLSAGVIREIAAYDVLARELSGRIVLSGVSPELKGKIESFAQPPVILCFESRAKALDFFSTPPQADATAATPALSAAAAAAHEELEKLKSEDRLMRSRMHSLEQENKRLKEQVVRATIARRPPHDEADYARRISFLEGKLQKILEETAPPAAEVEKK